MKIPMLVMIIITTVLCLLPFVWFMLIGKNNTRKKEKLFKDALKAENVSLSNKEQWNNSFIGLDTSKNILVFIKMVDQAPTIHKIDISQIKNCDINRKTRDFKKDKKMESELQSLSLEITTHSDSEPITLLFYDINDQLQEDFEMKRAETWRELIQKNRMATRLSKKVA